MNDWLYERLAHIVALTPWGLALVVVAGIAVVVVHRRRTRRLSRYRTALVALLATIAGASAIVLILSFAYMAPLLRSAGTLEAKVGREVPEMLFRRVSDAEPATLSALRGKVVLVNLFGTWCAPCREELPALDQLQRDYGTKGLVVLTLSDEARETVAPFLTEHAPATLHGYVETFGWLAIREFRPFTLFIDRRGILRDFMFGSQDYEVFERKVRQYLN